MTAKKTIARTEDAPQYLPHEMATMKEDRHVEGDDTIRAALSILASRLRTTHGAMASPGDCKAYCQLQIASLPHEVFCIMFLDVQNRMIRFDQMFRGTLTQTSVYPREVVKAALYYEAAAVVLTHNHPSGSVQPSRADESLTQTLRAALALVDVRVLDHIIVSCSDTCSLAERGLI